VVHGRGEERRKMNIPLYISIDKLSSHQHNYQILKPASTLKYLLLLSSFVSLENIYQPLRMSKSSAMFVLRERPKEDGREEGED
jgi:hypothetical protein